MKFPVDLLANVSQEQLEKSANDYLDALLYSNLDSPERLTLPDSTQVSINVSSVGIVPLYGQSNKQRILVLFSPSDPLLAVALYLLDRWWTVDDILRTADPSRRGVLPVDTLGERIALYVLYCFIYRVKEMSPEEIPFLCHGEKDHAKILWDDGEAVGFYSVKATGSLYSRFSSRTYQLPVMDSIFVRKCHRGKGSGLLMLTDFVRSFPEGSLGLKFPLSASMFRVCEKFLRRYPENAELLWEVEQTGGLYQRTNIASKVQVLDLSVGSKSLSFTEASHVIKGATDRDPSEDIKGEKATERAEELMEEATVLSASKDECVIETQTEGMKLLSAAELTLTGLRGSRPSGAEELGGKIIRIEHIAAGAPREVRGSTQPETEAPHLQTEETGEGSSSAAPGAEEAVGCKQSHGDASDDPPATVEPRRDDPQEEAKDHPAAPLLSDQDWELQPEVETLKQGDQGQKADEENIKVDVVTRAFALEKLEKEERQQPEEEELNDEEQPENKEEFGVKGSVPEEISAGGQLPAEGLELEEGHLSHHLSDDEPEEPPVVQRRKVHPKARSKKEGQHKEATHTRQAELDAGRSSGGKEAEDKQTQEQIREEEKDQSADRGREEASTTELLLAVEGERAEEAEEALPTSTEARMESKKVDRPETPPETDPEEEEEEPDGDGAEDRDGRTAADMDQPTASDPEEHVQANGGETPKVQLMETSDLQKPEPAFPEGGTGEKKNVKEVSGNEGKEESSPQNRQGEEEEAPLMETVRLRSGRKIVRAGQQEQKHEDTAAGRTCDQEHEAELVPPGTIGEDPVEEEPSAEEASTQPERDEELSLEEGEAAVHLQSLAEASRRNISGEHEAEAEKQTPVPPEADEGPEALAEHPEKPTDLTGPDAVQASNPEDTCGVSEEEEEMDPLGSDLQRVMVVLVDLRNSGRSQDETRAGSCVGEERPAAGMEEHNMQEALKEAADVPEEAVTTQTPPSAEDDGAGAVSADEEVPVVERRTLRRSRKPGCARRGRSAAATSQREDAKQEELVQEGQVKGEDEESSRDEPSMERALRKTKRSAPATSRRTSKRSRLQCQSDEEPSAEDGDVEETPSNHGEIAQKGNQSVDQQGEKPKAEDKEADVVSEEALTESGCPNGQEENSLREPSEDEQEAAVVMEEPGSLGNSDTAASETKPSNQQSEEREKETLLETSPGPGRPDTEDIAVRTAEEQGNEGPEGEQEAFVSTTDERMDGDSESAEAGAAESENFNGERPAGTAVLDPGTDGTRTGMEEETRETEGKSPAAAPEEGQEVTPPAEDAALSEVKGLGGQEPSAFTTAKEPEESDLVTTETETDRVRKSEVNTDEKESSSEEEKEEEEEEEDHLSDEDEEPVVMGRKVLRGRTVPAVVITPQRKRRRPDATADHGPRRRSRV